MIYRTILVVLIGLTLFGLYACDRENSVKSPDLGGAQPQDTTPADPPISIDTLTVGDLLYVAAGGSGSGTSASPYGSIQQAIDAAVLAGGVHTILVGTGTFNENLTLAPGVHLRGKRNPQADWEIDNISFTNVVGSALTGHSVAVIAQDLDQLTVLENLKIRSGDAPDPGANSVGIYCINSDSLTLLRCDVQAGLGGDGVAGAAGAAGANGQSGTVNDPLYGDPRCGGSGGDGADACPGGVRSDGEQGFCYDGTQTGGTAGLGDTAMEVTERNGTDGTAGADSEGGRAGVMTIALDASPLPMLAVDSGITGLLGEPGCGGGGGGGGPCWAWFDTLAFDTTGVIDTIYDTLVTAPLIIDTQYVEIVDTLLDTMYVGAEDGGWGGWGGEPGLPGAGGAGAGSSVALMLHSSTLLIENVKLVSQDGGTGGAGGDGGQGGSGGSGTSVVVPDPPDPPAPYRRVPDHIGGRGGRGGAAGDGGPGGGGTGGHSISLVLYQSSVVYERAITYVHGPAGDGGASDQYTGPDGLDESVYTIP